MHKIKTKLYTFCILISFVGIISIFTSVSALACNFQFNYDSIDAVVGISGKIGVQVEKTCNRCKMDDPLNYQFDGKHIQILGETDWEEINPNVYEKWLWISLSSPGEGFLRISCTCPKEGYQEAILPVVVTGGENNEPWEKALNGNYPYTLESELQIKNIVGKPELKENILTIGSVQMQLPYVPEELLDYQGSVRAFYITTEEKPLLLTSQDFLLHFDQYFTP